MALLLLLIGFVVFAPTPSGIGFFQESGFAWVITGLLIVQFTVQWGYYVLFEALNDGQTPGKRLLRLRVVRDGGYSVTFSASAVRNLVRIVDMQPGPLYLVGTLGMLMSRSGKRLGDLAAGTIVVEEDLVRAPIVEASGHEEELETSSLEASLSDAEFSVLERFVQRGGDLPPVRVAQLASQLSNRLHRALVGIEGPSDRQRLNRLYVSERAARDRGFAARGEEGAGRERHAIVAAGSRRWAGFAKRLTQAQKRGLSGLGEEGVREFVQEYRDVGADLARLRTASRGRDVGEIFYLNRLISGAHNLLYRRRTIRVRDAGSFLFVDVPREIRASVVPILLAGALLFGPAAVAYVAVVRAPDIALSLAGPGMVDRAEEGVGRSERGEGYIPDPGFLRPVMASALVANNVQVAIAAFGFGITAGVLTVWILFVNGIMLGSVFGLYVEKGIGSLLLAFVAPHGPVELAAICISGGAGFLLAAAILLPGPRTRRTALVLNGRRAIRLVAGATLMLLFAGAIEGFISPIEWWPLEVKLVVSGATVVLLYVYLRLATGAVKGRRGT